MYAHVNVMISVEMYIETKGAKMIRYHKIDQLNQTLHGLSCKNLHVFNMNSCFRNTLCGAVLYPFARNISLYYT